MTDSTTELDDLRAQVERLSSKNRELLAENRQLKDRDRQQTEALTALQARQRRSEVDAPAAQLIDDIAMPGAADAFRVLLEQHVRFDAGDDGQLVIRDLQGQPVKLPAIPGMKGREIEREARATVQDIKALVDTPELRAKFAAITVHCRASGGGASGGSTTRVVPRQAQKPAAEPRPETKLGLR